MLYYSNFHTVLQSYILEFKIYTSIVKVYGFPLKKNKKLKPTRNSMYIYSIHFLYLPKDEACFSLFWYVLIVEIYPRKIRNLSQTTTTLLGTNISPQKWHFEDDFPFPQVGYVSFLQGISQTTTDYTPSCFKTARLASLSKRFWLHGFSLTDGFRLAKFWQKLCRNRSKNFSEVLLECSTGW